MQNNKLQELTEKLYKEGLSKGQSEGDEILGKAKAEAQQIIDDAKAEAKQIVDSANKSAAEAKQNADAEIAMTSRQVITEVKQSVESMISAKAVSPAVSAAMNDTAFIQSLIKAAVESFRTDSEKPNTLSVLLPENKQKEFDKFIADAATKQLNGGKLEFKFSKQLNSGFQIGAKDKGYYISFTDSDFDNLFREYMRPKMRQLLFNDK